MFGSSGRRQNPSSLNSTKKSLRNFFPPAPPVPRQCDNTAKFFWDSLSNLFRDYSWSVPHDCSQRKRCHFWRSSENLSCCPCCPRQCLSRNPLGESVSAWSKWQWRSISPSFSSPNSKFSVTRGFQQPLWLNRNVERRQRHRSRRQQIENYKEAICSADSERELHTCISFKQREDPASIPEREPRVQQREVHVKWEIRVLPALKCEAPVLSVSEHEACISSSKRWPRFSTMRGSRFNKATRDLRSALHVFKT